jgi:Fe-S cluster assembly protein SufD
MNAPLSPLEIFRTMGIPTRRVEDWKYTDLRGTIDEGAFERPNGLAVTISQVPHIEAKILDDLPLPDWAARTVQRMPAAGAVDAAARAFNPKIVAVRVPAGIRSGEPLRLEYRSGGAAQIVLLLERGSSLTFMDMHHPQGDGLRNISMSVLLEEGAGLTHIRHAGFAKGLATIETVSAVLGRNSTYRVHVVEAGAKLCRAEWNVVLDGEGANAELSGATVLSHGSHADVTTRIDHIAGNTTSRQLFKKIVAGHSRAVYQGKITVRKDANGSDSRQTAKAILLGTRAEADLKPELEILADDVKCAHGAAIGDLDADSMFYLRSRGIAAREARSLLLRAFIEEAVDTIEDEAVRAAAWELAESELAQAMQAQS